MLKINIQSLKNDPVCFFEHLAPGSIDLGSEAKIDGPVDVGLKIHKISEKVFIQGDIRARVQVECARCLDEFIFDIEGHKVVWIAVPKHLARQRQQEENDQLREDEPTVLTYESDQVDMLPEIQNWIILSLPMKPLCMDNCPGLCPYCGNKNTENHHGCRGYVKDNPFSVLENIKIKKE